MEEKMLI